MNSKLYSVLEHEEFLRTLHNHQGPSPRWLYNILKIYIYSIKHEIWALTDLDYGWLAFLSKKFGLHS